MRVMYLINSLGQGGSERSLIELLVPLRAAGVDVTVATLSAPDERAVLESPFPTMVVGGRGIVPRIKRLRHLLREQPWDLLHTSLFESDVIGRVAARLEHVPVLTSLVSTTYDPVRFSDPAVTAWKLRGVRAIDSWTARNLTTHFHAVTHAVERSCVATMRLDPTRITVVERGRDTSRLGTNTPERRHAARQMLGLPQDALVVVNLGRQEWAKGQDDLVRAFDRVAARLDAAHLVIAGRRGAATSQVENAVRAARHRERVHVLGHRDDVGDVLCASDIFALPSRYEGIGGAAIEAMALGLPVVVTRLPSMAEVVEEGRSARLVAPGSPEDLAAALVDLLTDPTARRELGSRGEQIFQDRFNLERYTTRMAALYTRLGRETR